MAGAGKTRLPACDLAVTSLLLPARRTGTLWPMKRHLFALAVIFQVAAFACVVVAYAKRNDFTLEGAYFDRATGPDASAVSVAWTGPIAPWLIAAGVLLVAALLAFLINRRSTSAHPK